MIKDLANARYHVGAKLPAEREVEAARLSTRVKLDRYLTNKL